MAVTPVGRIRDLLILMQEKLDKDEVALLTVTGGKPAAELYVLNKKTAEMQTIKQWNTVADMNRWAMGDLRSMMAEFI